MQARNTVHETETAQQKAAEEALAVKRGEASRFRLEGPAEEMFETMSERELEELTATPAHR